jgi:hypothetical protein
VRHSLARRALEIDASTRICVGKVCGGPEIPPAANHQHRGHVTSLILTGLMILDRAASVLEHVLQIFLSGASSGM